MKFVLPFVISILALSGVALADHVEYCRVEVTDVILEQSGASGGIFCENKNITVRSVFSLSGIIQMPAETKLFYDDTLVETKTLSQYGTYSLAFDTLLSVPMPSDPNVTVTISAPCDPTHSAKSVNFTAVYCPEGYYKKQADYKPAIQIVSDKICMPIYTESYRCSDDLLQRQRLGENCTYSWITWQECEFGCARGFCLPPEEGLYEDIEESVQADVNFEPTFAVPLIVVMLAAIGVLYVAYYKIFSEYKIRLRPESF